MKALLGGLAALVILAAAMVLALDRAAVDATAGLGGSRHVHVERP